MERVIAMMKEEKARLAEMEAQMAEDERRKRGGSVVWRPLALTSQIPPLAQRTPAETSGATPTRGTKISFAAELAGCTHLLRTGGLKKSNSLLPVRPRWRLPLWAKTAGPRDGGLLVGLALEEGSHCAQFDPAGYHPGPAKPVDRFLAGDRAAVTTESAAVQYP